MEESTTYKFAKALQNRFGVIKGISDKDYVMNSYHYDVREKVDPFTKIKVESEFQKLSPGGAISYIEAANLQKNIPALLQIIEEIYNTIMYAEINIKSDNCQICGYEGEMELKKDEHGQYHYYCPNCGNHDPNKMNVARRVCGYISTTLPNQGRLDEIAHRYVHLDDHEADE